MRTKSMFTLLVGAGAATLMTAAVMAQDSSTHALLQDFVPVTDEMLANPAPENWITWRGNYASWGHSPLDQITDHNVGELRLSWSRSMEAGHQEVEATVYNGVMYLVNAGDVVQALDATNGDLIWEYRRQLPAEIDGGRYTGTQQRFRNLAIYEDKILLATQDAFLIALNAKTGQVMWETQRADWRDRVAQTAGPIVANGVAVTGSRCNMNETVGGGCFITGHNIETGEELWRTFTIARPGEPGGDTWGDLPLESRRHASAWMVPSFDPELGLVYVGTAVPAPSPEVLRGTGDADLLYTNSTLALRPETGEMVWYFQHLPRDNWDYDHPFERIIVNTAVAPDASEVPWINPAVTPGETRKVVTGIPGKTGVVWTLDAATGQFLWARNTVEQSVIADVNLDTGKPVINEDAIPRSVDEAISVCPHILGGKDQPSGAYSPATNAMYMPMNNACFDLAMSVEEAVPDDGYALSFQIKHAPGMDADTAKVGRIDAISAETGKTLWHYEQRAPIYGSLLTTAGNLLFGGDVVRRFRAFNLETGAIEWETVLNGPVSGRPMSYSVDGRQYIAITAGGVTQGTAFLSLTPELTTSLGSNSIFVFALPESN